MLAAQPLERVGVAGRRVELVALAAQPVGHRFEHVAIVVNQKQAVLRHGGRSVRQFRGVYFDTGILNLRSSGWHAFGPQPVSM